MESKQFEEYKSLVHEITKGMEQVKQLKASSSTKQETVLERMLSSYKEALSILNGSASEEQCESDTPACSVSSVQPRPSYKRKLFSKVTEQVPVTLSGLPPDDGNPWRKYGQKHILGCRYPRSYYRCLHRVNRGCLATKQMQRSDDNPSVYDVTYIGKHTCLRTQTVAPQVAVDAHGEKMPSLIRPTQTPR